MYLSVLLLSQVLAWLALCTAAPPKNDGKRSVLLLDDFTFPKIVPHSNADVVLLIAQKKMFGDYGTDSLRTDYLNFAFKMQTEGKADHVLFTQVIVNGPENRGLADEIVGEDFIHPKMYIFPAGSAIPIPYPDDQPFHLNTLTQFVAQHTTLSFQLPGTLKVFDDFASAFVNAEDDGRRRDILAQAEAAHELLEGPPATLAAYYIKMFRKILSEGLGYLKTEVKRKKRLMNDNTKLTKAGKRSIDHQLNVLQHFIASAPVSARDEI